MIKSRNLTPFSHICVLKLRKCNPAKYSLAKIAKLNTIEIKYQGLFLIRKNTVAVSVTDVETNLSLQACAVLESYKCYVLNRILIPSTLHDLPVAFP